jgi:hypothetical protein
MLCFDSYYFIQISNILNVINSVLSVATTVSVTVIITRCIVRVSRIPGASGQSVVVAEVIIESAVAYSLASVGYIVLLGLLIQSDYMTTATDYAELFRENMAVSLFCRVSLRDTEWSHRISCLQFKSASGIRTQFSRSRVIGGLSYPISQLSIGENEVHVDTSSGSGNQIQTQPEDSLDWKEGSERKCLTGRPLS